MTPMIRRPRGAGGEPFSRGEAGGFAGVFEYGQAGERKQAQIAFWGSNFRQHMELRPIGPRFES